MPKTILLDGTSSSSLPKNHAFALSTAAVVLLALLVREYFVLVAVVEIPIRGDIREYVKYAWNLQNHGVFSMAEPGQATPVPDAYRSPGFPWLLALCMWLRPDSWYSAALQMQVLMGTATVWITMLLARQWLASRWAIACGFLLALWPHHVAATGALLSEVAFGFALTAGAYSLTKALKDRHHGWLVLGALVIGYAYLINPLIALFPPAVAFLVWQKRGPRTAVCFVGIFLIPVLALGLHNGSLADKADRSPVAGRAVINLVQGSWPQYHKAWQTMLRGDPVGIAIEREIGEEIRLLAVNPRAGSETILRRIWRDPAYYVTWYLWQKPRLLWDWDIQLGAGGFYFLIVKNSPLDTHPVLRASSAVLRTVNPLLGLLALATSIFMLIESIRRSDWAFGPAAATAALLLYLTAIHTIFQSEPRYANAYRGFEIVMVVSILQFVIAKFWPPHRNQLCDTHLRMCRPPREKSDK